MARKQNKAAPKWRVRDGIWRAGPFRIHDEGRGIGCDYRAAITARRYDVIAHYYLDKYYTLEDAKAACQRLANEIMRAMKPAKKGKS